MFKKRSGRAARKPKSLKEIADKTMRQAEERQQRIEQHPEKKISPVKLKLSDKEVVTELYLWSLARNPNEKELQVGLNFLKTHAARRTEAVQDLFWALLNSRDFLLMH